MWAQPLSNGVGDGLDQLDSGPDPDLLEDLLEVIFDGIWADEELGADLSAGKPVGNEPGDLEFSYREIGG
jgi:hypothetical protein